MTALRLLAVPALSDNYVWLLADATGNALAVDPGEVPPVDAALRQHGWTLRAILLTHHHGDHVAGAAALAAQWCADVHAPDDERIANADRRVGEGDRVALDAPSITFEVLAVPGHTSSHVAFHGGGYLFCGDTLFSLGCGRLFEGSPAQMLASLERLARLPGETQVCCGHEYTLANAAFARQFDTDNPALETRIRDARRLRAEGRPTLPSTIAAERAANPFLRVDTPALAAALGDGTRVQRFAELRRRKDAFRAPAA